MRLIVEVTGQEPIDPSGPLVDETFAMYRKRVMPEKCSQRWQEAGLGVVEREFKGTPLALMTWDRSDMWIERLKTAMVDRTRVENRKSGRPKADFTPKVTTVRKRQCADESVRRYASFLSGVLDGVARTREERLLGLRVDQHPARGHLLPRKKVPVPVALTQEEVACVLAATTREPVRRWALLTIKLGCRVEESMTLE